MIGGERNEIVEEGTEQEHQSEGSECPCPQLCPCKLYSCEIWTLSKQQPSRVQATQMNA